MSAGSSLRSVTTLAILCTLPYLAGCRSRFVSASIVNGTDAPLRLIEVDYPNASFGLSTLAPHAVYHYRFKVQGSGELQLVYTDALGHVLTRKGPTVAEGDQRALAITIGPEGAVQWKSLP